MRPIRAAAVAASLLLAVTLVAGCAPADEGTDTAADATAESCVKDQLALVNDGKLTIGTDTPAYEPWFKEDDPTNGEGFESAVAFAVADELGFAKDEVEWIDAPFNSLVQPGEKPFDLAINQVSITDERRNAIDFSSGYYDVTQAVITVEGSPIADASSVADLKDAKLGAAVGTTSYTLITDTIQPTQEPAVFDTNDVAKQALSNGQIDGLVVDLPTAFFITAAELDNGKIVGQFEGSGSDAEQFGLALTKDSGLTGCATLAIDNLRESGKLGELEDEWLSDAVGAPVLS